MSKAVGYHSKNPISLKKEPDFLVLDVVVNKSGFIQFIPLALVTWRYY
jgi:hypothetical protein